MNLEKIKEIVNSNSRDDVKNFLIINCLSEDKNAIPLMMEILDTERKNKKELIQDMNLELSRSHIFIEISKESFNKKFVLDEIEKFYLKYKGVVTHCFNRFNNDSSSLKNKK